MEYQNRKARVIAFYLPQFHPIPENDKWGGKGFTEWTNVGKAKPLFKGHYQPRVPADLGYYDLRMPEVREAQAEMAREAGIEGFCYWHYWFGNGKQLLERPFNEVLESGKPNFPFCLGWANHTWTTKTWANGRMGQSTGMIAEQKYLGKEDYMMHFEYVLKAFRDPRYICVDGKPLFVVFDPYALPNDFIPLWRELAQKNGLKDIHFVGYTQNTSAHGLKDELGNDIAKGYFSLDEAGIYYQYLIDKLGFDAVASFGTWRAEVQLKNRIWFIIHRVLSSRFHISSLDKYDYLKIIKHYYVPEDKWDNVYPSLLPQWDRSPRSGVNGIYVNSTPVNFKKMIYEALNLLNNKQDEHRILFLKSWNEWAEGNYVEPDLKYGHGYLDVLRECLVNDK